MLLAFAASREIWLAIALVPLLLLVERLYGRVVGLRHEIATALEAFANIVDERDSLTYGHSVRVAGYVRDLARGLGLPPAEVRRLWWAGRLHDLGEVAVDATVLSKPGKLSPAEWGTVCLRSRATAQASPARTRELPRSARGRIRRGSSDRRAPPVAADEARRRPASSGPLARGLTGSRRAPPRSPRRAEGAAPPRCARAGSAPP